MISAVGPDIAMHLVYEPRSVVTMPNWRAEKHPDWKGPSLPRSDSANVREWMALGIKAIERKSLEESQERVGAGLGLELLPEAGRAWDSSLEMINSILR